MLASAAAVLALGRAGPADAACSSFSPASGTSVTCDGANATGVIAPASDHVTVDVLNGGSIAPASGPSIWLGPAAGITLESGSTTGKPAISTTYAVLMGDGSTIDVEGLLQSQGGVAGPDQSTGFANAHVTVGQGGQITTSGSAFNAALYGRGGNNVYQVDGAILATGTSGQGIAVGDGDTITIGATGTVETQAGDTSNPINGSGKANVTVTMDAGSRITLHGIGRGIQLGTGADVTVAGTITSLGDAATSNSSGGVAVEVGSGSTVWLQEGGQIVTGNAGGLGNGGNGGIGISTRGSGLSNSTVVVDGLIDTQKGHGVYAGTGDDITVGSTGQITVRGSANGIYDNANTSAGSDHLTIDVAGRVEALGTGRAIYLYGNSGPVDLNADVTVEEGGVLFAQSNQAYGQIDGAGGSYPAIIDNLVVAGRIERGNAGIAIDLNDGADTITLFPTAVIVGSIDGGTNTGAQPEADAFVLDGAGGTTGTFDFTATPLLNFEIGRKQGAGTWVLEGDAGTGLAGTFEVAAGRLVVNGTVADAAFQVDDGATLAGTGTVGATTVLAGGTHAPGNSIGAQTVAGDYVNHGTLEIEATPADADQVVVTGNVDVAGGTLKVVELTASGWPASVSHTIVDNQGANAVTGTFGTVTNTLAFLDVAVDYAGGDGNDVVLTLYRNTVAFEDVGESAKRRATGAGAESVGPGTPLYDAIVVLDVPDARTALDLLSGEVHASARGMLLDDSRFVREAAIERLRGASTGAGTSPGAMPAGNGAAPPNGVWGRAFGSWSEAGSDGDAAGLSRSIGGFFVGADRAFQDRWRVGVIGGYSRSAFDVDARASSGTVDSYHGGVYGGLQWGPLGVRVGGAYSWHEIDTRRAVDFPGFSERLRAGYDAATAQAFGDVGYRVQAGPAAVEPFAGAAYVNVHNEGFTERGGAAALAADGDDADAAFTTLGVRADARLPLGTASLALHGSLGWRHAFGDVAPAATFAFAGGTPFTIAGLPIDRDAVAADAGISVDVAPNVALAVSYSGQIGDRVGDHGVRGSLSVRF